ncbi:hypothetical protein [Maritimibacter sp. UBA3975]|uniref:hypothetical protein n=1 Tax=Maritimibacter sp. UBA3975 TaxID=1946833 RepID=UPI000C0A98F8|nr:hypothetical protein [Maritimibacter sp. UBA3975]MAM59867.1 hypothetical protein [Maritimibacter sp.]|tara:strand:- start:4271 stop:4858 length:588 start_codon:yes stop_codon:yes gene_type:complete
MASYSGARIAVIVGAVALIALGFQQNKHKQERDAQPALRMQKLEAKSAAVQAAQRKADEEARVAWFATVTAADLEKSGAACVSEATKLGDEDDSLFGWAFSGLPPSEFDGVKSAVAMGLRATAYGSETSGMAIIREQIPRLIQYQKDEYQLTSFDLITYEQYDTYNGIKHRLVRYTCRLLGPNEIDLYRRGEIAL